MNKTSPTPAMSDDSPTESGTLPNEKSDLVESEPGTEEFGGPKGKEPTRFGDWEKNGRCIDF